MPPESGKAPRLLEGGLILALVLVALAQLYLSNQMDLTTWRGGGFGMYTEPHPHQGRLVWLDGRNQETAMSVRLSPLDERLSTGIRRDTQLKRDLLKLKWVGWRSQGFPAAADLCWAREEIHTFMDKHGTDPTIAALFPTSDLRIKVMNLAIAPDFQTLESHLLSDRELCSN
jgi:hypothetical protein